jgi:hypothetical protein
MRRHHQPVTMLVLATMLVFGGLWAGGALRASQTLQKQSETAATLQSHHAEELGERTAELTRQMQDAALRDDAEGVTRLAQKQQQVRESLNDNYTWLAQQVSNLGDAESLAKLGGGLATGGVVGALQSFSQVLAGQKTQANQDVLLREATRRMEDLYDLFEGRDAAAPAEALVDSSRHTILFLGGRHVLVPIEMPPTDEADPVPDGEAASPATDGPPPSTPGREPARAPPVR